MHYRPIAMPLWDIRSSPSIARADKCGFAGERIARVGRADGPCPISSLETRARRRVSVNARVVRFLDLIPVSVLVAPEQSAAARRRTVLRARPRPCERARARPWAGPIEDGSAKAPETKL